MISNFVLPLHNRKRIPPSTLIKLAHKSKDQQDLVDSIPSIAMFDTSIIPRWSTADTSPNEYAILKRARKLRQGNVKKKTERHAKSSEEDSRPISARSVYPLAMAALGHGAARNRARVDRNLVSRLMCLFVILAVLLEPQVRAGLSKVSEPTLVAPPTRRGGFSFVSKNHLFSRNMVPKHSGKNLAAAAKEAATVVVEESSAAAVVETPLVSDHQIRAGWKIAVLDAPKQIVRRSWGLACSSIRPVTNKMVNSKPMDLAAGHIFPLVVE